MKNQAKYTARWIYTVLALAAVAAAWYLFKEDSVVVEVSSIERGVFEGSLQIDGVIRSRHKITVTSYADGDLSRVEWKVGDTIEKDDIVAILAWDLKKPIRSPLAGVISKVYRESAGPIQRGAPIIDIIDPSALEVVAKVLTTDAVRIPSGAQVEITGFGQEGASLPGKVAKISRAGFVELSALGIEEEKTEVRVDFLSPPPAPLGDNFHVELSIYLSRDENVLLLPVSALFKSRNSWAVYKIADGRARLTVVEIDKRNNELALIRSGLKEGDRVILFPSDQIIDGVSVKIRDYRESLPLQN